MHAIRDVLQYAKELKDAGVPANQAEIHAQKMAILLENNLATKQDIQDLKQEIQKLKQETTTFKQELILRMERIESHVETKISSLDSKLNWLFIFIGGIASIVGIMGYFKHF